MQWSKLPPLNSLRGFTALAEAGSYKDAAIQLHVTHAAVSQQVRALEERLGVSLVVAQGRGIQLTKYGLELARELKKGFDALQAGIEQTVQSSASQGVQLSTSPAFAMQWLMPKIQEFQTAYPEIPLLINPTVKLVELTPDGIEVVIRYRYKNILSNKDEPVLISDMVVVAASSLLEAGPIDTPSALLAAPWLQELNTNEVSEWFNRQKIDITQPLKISQMPGNLIMQAVRQGDGITYTARAFLQQEIQQGSIQVLHSDSAVGHYCLETCKPPLRRSTQILVDWLLDQHQVCTS